jgi:hypothetical protein
MKKLPKGTAPSISNVSQFSGGLVIFLLWLLRCSHFGDITIVKGFTMGQFVSRRAREHLDQLDDVVAPLKHLEGGVKGSLSPSKMLIGGHVLGQPLTQKPLGGASDVSSVCGQAADGVNLSVLVVHHRCYYKLLFLFLYIQFSISYPFLNDGSALTNNRLEWVLDCIGIPFRGPLNEAWAIF